MDRLQYLLTELINLRDLGIKIPEDYDEKRHLLRSLMNVFNSDYLPAKYFDVEKEFFQEELKHKNITDAGIIGDKLFDTIYLWQGDITTLKIDAIVNAANSKLLGCFIPHHGCIDNAIHSASGLALRMECKRLMEEQGHDEGTGLAKITGGYNLPSNYVIHTVGPMVGEKLNTTHIDLLKKCYISCLDIAKENNLRSIAFCSISTGEYNFPIDKASEIALRTIIQYLEANKDVFSRIVINVFSREDYDVYKRTSKRLIENKTTY